MYTKEAGKLKSREMKDEGWTINDEQWRMKDERWWMKDEGYTFQWSMFWIFRQNNPMKMTAISHFSRNVSMECSAESK